MTARLPGRLFWFRLARKHPPRVSQMVAMVISFALLACSSEQAELEKKVNALLKAEDCGLAIKVTSEAVEKAPDKSYTRYHKTLALANCGRTLDAISEYHKLHSQTNKHAPELLRATIVGGLRDQSKGIPMAAAVALSSLGDRTAIPELRRTIDSAKGVERVVLAEALGKLGESDVALAELRAALRSPETDIRKQAVSAFGRLGSKTAIPDLRAALKDPGIWSDAAGALANLDDRDAIGDIRAALIANRNPYGNNWVYVIGYLAKLGDRDAASELVGLLDSSQASVRWAAADGIGSLGDAAWSSQLSWKLTDSNELVRSSAIQGLGKIGERNATDDVRKGLADSSGLVRRAAVNALAALGDKNAAPELLKALGDSEAYVRMAAADALVKLQGASELRSVLQSSSQPAARQVVAWALSEAGDTAAIPELTRSLGSQDGGERWRATVLLAKLVR